MAKIYLEQLQGLLGRLAPGRGEFGDVVCKHFFSGAAAYFDGCIFMTLTPKGLALKLPERDRAALLAEGAKPLRYFPKAPEKKEYVILPEGIQSDPGALVRWIRSSIRYSKS